MNSRRNLIKIEIRDEKWDKHIPMKFWLQIHFESWQCELIGHPFVQPFELAVVKLWSSKLIDGNDEWNVDGEDGDSDDSCEGEYEFDDNGDDDYLDCELLRKASAKHFNETKVINKSSTKLLTNVISNNNNHDQQTNNSVVPLVERLEKSFDAEEQSDKEFSDSSSLSSMIELGESCVDNQ